MHYFCFKNIDANNYYCNEYIADHAAAVDDDYDEDYEDADVDGYVDGDNVQFQMLSINMLTMILMSDDHHRHHTHACPRFLTPAAAGINTPPYTCPLLEVISKLQNSSSSVRLT